MRNISTFSAGAKRPAASASVRSSEYFARFPDHPGLEKTDRVINQKQFNG